MDQSAVIKRDSLFWCSWKDAVPAGAKLRRHLPRFLAGRHHWALPHWAVASWPPRAPLILYEREIHTGELAPDVTPSYTKLFI